MRTLDGAAGHDVRMRLKSSAIWENLSYQATARSRCEESYRWVCVTGRDGWGQTLGQTQGMLEGLHLLL